MSSPYTLAPIGGFDGGSDTRSDHGSQHGGSQHGGSQHGGSQHGGSQHGGSQHGGSQHGGSQHSGSPGSDRGSAGRGSQSGRAHSRSGSTSSVGNRPSGQGQGVASAVAGFPPGLGFDPAISEEKKQKAELPRRLELPADAYAENGKAPVFAARPGLNQSASSILVDINQFRIEAIKCPQVFTYTMSVSPLPRHDIIHKKLFECGTVQKAMKKQKGSWIYDGRVLFWSTNNVPEGYRWQIDLDNEQGKPSRPQPDVYFVHIKQTGKIDLTMLQAYLNGKCSWDSKVLECMNFLDHVLRDTPTRKLLAIGKNYYDERFEARFLDGHVEAVKGIYSAMRLNSTIRSGGLGLGINVDVTNTCFWMGQDMEQMLENFLGNLDARWNGRNLYELSDEFRPEEIKDPETGQQVLTMSSAFMMLRRLQRLKFKVRHRGKMEDPKIYTVARIPFDAKRWGKEGCNSKNYTFTIKKTGEVRSVWDHFNKQYNIRLTYWRLPVMETSRGGAFPFECVEIPRFQRYPYKLNGNQTAEMIKFAVTRPAARRTAIMGNVESLGWKNDPTLKEFGITVSTKMPTVNAKLIEAPEVGYGKNTKATPGTSGRWDLRNKVFLKPNTVQLDSWGVLVVNGCVDEAGTNRFLSEFVKTYRGHGGNVSSTKPVVLTSSFGQEMPDIFYALYQRCIQAFKKPPTIIFCILPVKEQWAYERLKKNAECRFGCLTQMCLGAHVRKAQPQYCSNVAMKVNCKLGGTNCKVLSRGHPNGFFKEPTMMIGADISHPSIGTEDPSFAAITISMDKECARYAASCQTNSYKEEILQQSTIDSALPQFITKWMNVHRVAPKHVFFIRDGVAEGQFAHVVNKEVHRIREVFKRVAQVTPKITAIIAAKRHHIRFFPQKGDRNGNPLPGTLVETEVTHPYHYDFYLCSHVAIQGTARPVHYSVIHDEIKMPVDLLQKMIYHQCYQYQRSTTPVSLHPAAYYAHLAGARCKAHQDISSMMKHPFKKPTKHWSAKSPTPRDDKKKTKTDTDSDTNTTARGPEQGDHAPPLIPFGTDHRVADRARVEFLTQTMWYI